MTAAWSRMGLLALAMALPLALGGCALPRGAAVETEVLGTRLGRDEATADFAVEPVTRDSLALYASWPAAVDGSMGWIPHQEMAPTRIIAPGDVLAVTLWNTEDNSLLTAPGQRSITMPAVTVSSGGSVFMPYIGNIRVAGLSPDRARETIEGRFIEVTPSAQVQLEVAQSSVGNSVSLVGGVGRPGSYPLRDQSATVLSLIAEGGGVAPALNNPQIRLMRGGDIYGTSIERLFEDPGLDTTLRGGDKVIVEADQRFFLSLGAAGSEDVHPFPRDELSAIEAISIIGGVTDTRANPKGILVLRQYPPEAVRADGTGPTRERVVFTLDLTTADGLFSAGRFAIQSGDLVYATESPVTAVQSIIGILGSAIGVRNQLSN